MSNETRKRSWLASLVLALVIGIIICGLAQRSRDSRERETMSIDNYDTGFYDTEEGERALEEAQKPQYEIIIEPESIEETPAQETIVEESISEEVDTLPDLSPYQDIPLSDTEKIYIINSAEAADIPAELMFGVAEVESEFDKNCVSHTNDHGLFQINKSNFKELSKNFDLSYQEVCDRIYDLEFNCDAAVYFITEYRDNYTADSWHMVLMYYNMGPSSAKKCFSNGKYSSSYSRKVIDKAKEYGLTDTSL